tara:strand:- start:536 stop:718 length:183 start_codon:yes stop_codon:yes gene_type:complete
MSLLRIIDEKYKLLTSDIFFVEDLSRSRDDCKIFEEIIAIIERISNETRTSNKVKPLFTF